MARAKWTTTPREVVAAAGTDGTFTFSAPLLDSGTKAATIRLTITADRQLRLEVTNEPGAAGFVDFQAWMREA